MRELHARHRALRLDEAEDAREHLDVLVCPQPEIVRADPALGQHGRRLGEHRRGAADGAAAEVHEVPVVREAVAARVLAHRRDENPVSQPDVAELERGEQMAGCSIGGRHVSIIAGGHDTPPSTTGSSG
jgi:hypothetical protein